MLRILKVSLIDWCYRLGRCDAQDWAPLTDSIQSALIESSADVCVIERNSLDWHQDFCRYFGNTEYSMVFIPTAMLDTRLNIQGGTTALIRKNTTLSIALDASIELPSAKPQFDGGQPTSIPVISVNGIRVAIGCMPQNLGREMSVTQMYQHNDFLRSFWGDGSGQDIVAVPVWDKDANCYDIHVWQTRLRDAVADDRVLIDFIREGNTIGIVEMFQDYHKEHCVIPQAFMTQLGVINPGVNPLTVCSNLPGLSVTAHDLHTEIHRLKSTSFVKYFTLNHPSF